MCRPNNANANATNSTLKRRSSSSYNLLLTHDSFVFNDIPTPDDDKHHKSHNPHLHGLGGPSLTSTLLTVSLYVAALFLIEHLCKLGIAQYAHIDPILENETNRAILARHLGVDFVCLAVCAYIAISNRHACKEIIDHGYNRIKYGTDSSAYKKSCDGMGEGGYEERIFQYRPGAQRLLTMFFVYQVKNMYDTIVWGDGIEFVLHHIFAGAAAWGGLYPGGCHFYALFYFGFSEVSTAILCLLANFDPEFGVQGLEHVFPKTKIVLGALFVTSFIICRLIMWPFVTYYFFQDTLAAIRSENVTMANGRKGFLRMLLGCCAGLSLIQFVFVAMIVKTGKEEIYKFLN